jgi:CheY-like chemotaxis protein
MLSMQSTTFRCGLPAVSRRHLRSCHQRAEALAVMDGARVSLALLDMRMPVLDGWGFARELRERRSWLPVIVMSAGVNAQQWADEIGAAGCVSKPFDLVELLVKVDRLVAPHQGRRQVVSTCLCRLRA